MYIRESQGLLLPFVPVYDFKSIQRKDEYNNLSRSFRKLAEERQGDIGEDPFPKIT